MDASGARLLAARIAASVRTGSVIELVFDSDADLRAGDRGVVQAIDDDGAMLVAWEQGFECTIDPQATVFRAVPAA